MAEWIADALASVRRGEPLAMVTVVGAQGSTPRETGARMLVWADRFTGTVGGGSLERQGLDQARKLLAQTARRHALQDYPLGPLLGQCCGGHVRLMIERIDGESLGWLEPAAAMRHDFTLEATFDDGALRRAIAPSEGASDGPRTPIADVRRLAETIRPVAPPLLIFGAGHVGQAVARAFEPLPFALTWLASREDLRSEASGTRAEIVDEAELLARVAEAPDNALFAIFTHSHDLDYRLTKAVLARGDFRYLGLIGSQTKRRRFESRLRDDGVSDEQLARLTCPIGVQTLKSKAPAVIAVALAAELLQLTGDDGK